MKTKAPKVSKGIIDKLLLFAFILIGSIFNGNSERMLLFTTNSFIVDGTIKLLILLFSISKTSRFVNFLKSKSFSNLLSFKNKNKILE